MSGFVESASPPTLAALTQWRLDFRVVRQAADARRRDAGIKHLAARWAPRALLAGLAGKEIGAAGGTDPEMVSEAVGVIEDVLSTTHGRALWAGASVDVLDLVVQGCQGGSDSIEDESIVRRTCARLLEGMLIGGGGSAGAGADDGQSSHAAHHSRHLLSPSLAKSHPALADAVVDLVASPDTDVSSAACNVVMHAASSVLMPPSRFVEDNAIAAPHEALFHRLVAALFSTRTARMLQADADVTACFRLLDVAVNLAGISERAFRGVCDAGLFATLEDALCADADDVLLQMSVMEAIGKITRAPYMCGRLVGESSNGESTTQGGGSAQTDQAAARLHNLLRDIAGVPLPESDDSGSDDDHAGDEEDPLVRNGAIRILATVYSTLLGPDNTLSSERTKSLLLGLICAIEKSLATANSASVGVCMQAIRGMAVASRVCASSLLSSTEIVACIVGLCVDREDQRRALGLHTLADLVRGSIISFGTSASGGDDASGVAVPDEAGARRAVAMIGEAWSYKTGTRKDTMLVLVDYAKEPLAPTRNACFDLLAAVAQIPSGWGLRRLFGRGEVHTFLFDRRTETTKEGKEWKFGVLAAAFHCPAREAVLGGEEAAAVKQLREFLQDGPFVARGAGKPAEVVGLHL